MPDNILSKNHYEVLGVKSDAKAEEIKTAYRQKALEVHPDKNLNDPNAAAKFKNLNESYQTLSDPKKRAEYDSSLKSPGDSIGTTLKNNAMDVKDSILAITDKIKANLQPNLQPILNQLPQQSPSLGRKATRVAKRVGKAADPILMHQIAQDNPAVSLILMILFGEQMKRAKKKKPNGPRPATNYSAAPMAYTPVLAFSADPAAKAQTPRLATTASLENKKPTPLLGSAAVAVRKLVMPSVSNDGQIVPYVPRAAFPVSAVAATPKLQGDRGASMASKATTMRPKLK